MNKPQPGVLAVRAINQYRRRDVIPYLALRYYLANSAARADGWAQIAATNLVRSRDRCVYHRALHFKEIDSRHGVRHRDIYLPGANESLAEAALLDKCSQAAHGFRNPQNVYSYILAEGTDRSGMFKPYYEGFRNRHYAIANACDACPDGIVRYVDIKRFYPSIRIDTALNTWLKCADRAKLNNEDRELGEKLLDDYRTVPSGGEGVITGPMFSHLIGNLVLRDLDQKFSEGRRVHYSRYVDDIVLVGSTQAVEKAVSTIRHKLGDLGLRLHDDSAPKSIKVSASEWLQGRHDFAKDRGPNTWQALIGDLKRFLVLKTEETEVIRNAFSAAGIRIPVLYYGEVSKEQHYLKRLRNLLKNGWLRLRVQRTSASQLVERANQLRRSYESAFYRIIAEAREADGFARKRRIPRLRFYASRLVYLSSDDGLAELAREAAELAELRFHSAVMLAVSTGNIDHLLPLGPNAAQAAAQPLKAAKRGATTTLTSLDEAGSQALAVFLFNGVPVEQLNGELVDYGEDLIRFANSGADLEFMQSSNPFLRELACLHGLAVGPRHPEVLQTAFDKDEDIVMDAIDQLEQSLSL